MNLTSNSKQCTGTRRPRRLRLDYESKAKGRMIGAVDIGGAKLAIGLIDENGEVLAKNEGVTGPESNYSASLDSIVSMLREMEQRARVEITGVGIGSNARGRLF